MWNTSKYECDVTKWHNHTWCFSFLEIKVVKYKCFLISCCRRMIGHKTFKLQWCLSCKATLSCEAMSVVDRRPFNRGINVTGASFMTVRMLFSITHLLFQLHGRLHSMSEWQRQTTGVWEFQKITMRISQLSRNIQRENIIFYFGLKWLHFWILTIRSCIVKISGRLFWCKC